MPFDELLKEYEARRARALAMGGPERLAKRKAAGWLNARERIDRLLDPGSFMESGLFGVSLNPADGTSTPGDGKLAGFGRIEGRDVAFVANDFTVKGASSGGTNMKKIGHMKRVATERGMPLVFLGESSGARMPDHMGSRGMGSLLGQDGLQYRRTRETPWAAASMGMCFGSSTWYCVLSDFNVFRKGAVMAVSSPLLASLAMNETVEPESLGGWRMHAEVTGYADQIAGTDEEAIDLIRRFLGYLPGHHAEAPPDAPVPAGSGEHQDRIYRLLPESRTQVYDMRKLVQLLVDRDSAFEVKPRFGKTAITSLARLGGRTVGIVANNPLFKGGALDADACDKITSFLVLCDSFNVPIVMLVDTPGFSIGIQAEMKRAPGKIMNFMNALSLVTVPKLTVLTRKSYGQAYINMGGGRNSDEFLAWPTAEVSFMDPASGVTVTWGTRPGEPGYDQALERMQRDNSIWDAASIYAVQDVILPHTTRDTLVRLLDVHRLRRTKGVGQHLLRAWPTSY